MAQANVDVSVVQRSEISDQTDAANSGATQPQKSGQMRQGGTADTGSAQMGSPVALITDWASI